MLSRREFLSAPAVSFLPAATAAPAPPRVCLAAPSAARPTDMPEVFRELGIAWDVVEPGALEQADLRPYALLWIPAPNYPEPEVLSPAALRAIQECSARGAGVYAEFVTNFPGVAASERVEKTGIARLFVTAPLDVPGALGPGAILDEHDSYCLAVPRVPPGVTQTLAFGRVAGVQTVVPQLRPAETWPGLLAGRIGQGRFAFAATSLSDYRKRQYAPLGHWEKFMRHLVLALLAESDRARVLAAYLPLQAWSEPRRWVQPGEKFRVTIQTQSGAKVAAREVGPGVYQLERHAGKPGLVRLPLKVTGPNSERNAEVLVRVEERRAAYRRALTRNMQWFERSGALLKPDGSLGVAEWISGPDWEGNRMAFGAEQMFSPERADCLLESGLAFWMYGKLAPSPRHCSVGEKILARSMDFQRLEHGDQGYGLWNTRGRGGPAFPDDTSWGTICALAASRYLTNRMFLRRGLISAQAQLRAFGPDESLHVPQQAKATPTTPPTRMDYHPHSGGCVLAAWFYAYGITGDDAYLRTARPMLDRMIEGFPKISRYIISRTCESSRFLLPLTLGWYYTREPRYQTALEEQAAYLRSRMAPCGAIREGGSNTGSSVEGGDLGLTYSGEETISDQLYTTSFAAMNFWIAYKATGDAAYLKDYFRVTDYLVRIQIESPDPMIDGGWMRGFDYSLWEYYGSNADQWWNAYVMETGWQNAIIDIALALYLMDDPFLEPRRG